MQSNQNFGNLNFMVEQQMIKQKLKNFKRLCLISLYEQKIFSLSNSENKLEQLN